MPNQPNPSPEVEWAREACEIGFTILDYFHWITEKIFGLIWPIPVAEAFPQHRHRRSVGPEIDLAESDVDLELSWLLFKQNDTKVNILIT